MPFKAPGVDTERRFSLSSPVPVTDCEYFQLRTVCSYLAMVSLVEVLVGTFAFTFTLSSGESIARLHDLRRNSADACYQCASETKTLTGSEGDDSSQREPSTGFQFKRLSMVFRCQCFTFQTS